MICMVCCEPFAPFRREIGTIVCNMSWSVVCPQWHAHVTVSTAMALGMPGDRERFSHAF